MMQPYWRIIKTENGHEPDVARALADSGHEVFLPIEIRHHTMRWGKARAGAYFECPLIPRRVFARLELEVFLELRRTTPALAAGVMDRNWEIGDVVALVEAADSKPGVEGVTGWETDAEGFPEIIPSAEMEAFREAHAKWLVDCQTRAVGGKPGRGAKRRAYKMQDGLEELKRRMTA